MPSTILSPSSGDVAEIALAASQLAESGAPSEGFNRHFVQAFALLAGGAAKRIVQSIGHVADGVLLHAKYCRH